VNDAPCDDCEHSPCTYISATHCEKLKEWMKEQEDDAHDRDTYIDEAVP